MNKLLIIFLLLTPFAYALAGGMTVNPSRLTFDIERGKTEIANIVVTNPTTDVQIFEVYPDNFTDIISVSPKSFTLESNASKTIEISVNESPSQNMPQILLTNISVIARPLTQIQFQANTGVKVPITISVKETARIGDAIILMKELIAGIIFIIAFMATVIYWLHKNIFRKAK